MTPEEVKALPLGAPVTIAATLRRRSAYEGRHNVRWKRWARKDLPAAQPGVYIGWRSLVDGRAEWEDEVGYVFDADTSTRQVAALVAIGVRRAPVLVPCDALTLVRL